MRTLFAPSAREVCRVTQFLLGGIASVFVITNSDVNSVIPDTGVCVVHFFFSKCTFNDSNRTRSIYSVVFLASRIVLFVPRCYEVVM